MVLARSSWSAKGEQGFSLLEVLVASTILTVGVLALAQLFALSTTSNTASKNTSYASALAEQKLEELRALTWGFDRDGLPLSDTTSNTAVLPETTTGGPGLSPSPSTSLQQNTQGYVDYVNRFGQKVGTGDTVPPDDAVYTRRWSIEPLPTHPNSTLIIQVLVTPYRNRGQGNLGNVARLRDEARLITVKTRKAS